MPALGVGIGLPFQGGAKSESAISALTRIGLTTGLQLVLDAGDAASYTSGQSWFDRSGNGYDFFRGSDNTSQASDPTFNGTPGGLGQGEYWSFDGGDYFTYDTTNETWMQNLHKALAKFTIYGFFWPGSTGSQRILGDTGSGSPSGLILQSSSGGQLQLVIQNAGATALSAASGTNGDIAPTAWNFFAVSLDESVGANGGQLYIRNKVTNFASTYSSPASGNASQVFQIGAGGNNTIPLVSGSRLPIIILYEGVAHNGTQVAAVKSAIRGRFGV